ncbi:PAS domain S-box protein [Flavobacterium sp. LB2P6]|uniref:sensor histidine kinase n=1 Tax=Flavobacterium sp. LB2P6 TaxID=3401714 RepID=UPI003AAE59FC
MESLPQMSNENKNNKSTTEEDIIHSVFFNISTDLFSIISSEGCFIEVNEAWKSTLGYSVDDLIGKPFEKFLHPDDIEQTAIKFTNVVQGQEVINFINRYLCKDGSYKWLEWKGKINEKNNRIYNVARDVTIQKQLEIELLSSKEIYHQIFYSNPNPMWIFDLETLAFIEVNQTTIDQYGYTKEEFLSMTLKDITPEEDIPLLLISAVKAISEYNADQELWRHITKNGEILFAELSAKSMIYEGKKARSVIINNITKRVEAEKALFESETKYRTLTENSNDLIMRFDREYRHLYANSATMLYFGMQADIFLGKTHEELGFPEADYKYWDAKIEEVFVTGKAIKDVITINDGKTHVDWSLVPEFDKNGNVITVLSFSRDITEVIKIQLELKESEKNLKLRNAEKDKFFSIIAHDLRSPFNGFLGLTDLLVNDLSSLESEEIESFAFKMNKSAYSLFSLLENLLEWSQMQNGLIKYNPTIINLNDEISFILDTMEESFKGKAIKLSKNILLETTILGDKHMLNAVFRNLISNAFKFTPSGGSIEILSRVDTENNLEISIKDSGIGMSEKIIENLFSLSEKINRKGTDNEESSGLGLLLVKEYLDKHNGKTSVCSQVGVGSTFIVTLPLR